MSQDPVQKSAKAESIDMGKQKNMISPPSISLPKGGGAIRGIGEKFAANPVTGTGSMTVPIATSPGRSGFGPQLSLSYDSGAGNGPFGIGWNLSLPSITRKTDKGLPQYLDSEESDVFILTGSEDLVPVLLDRCVQVNWAGGLRTGKKMVGRAEYVTLNRVIPPWTGTDRAIRQAIPTDGAYKVLFCLAARTDTITSQMMANLDMVRQGWEIYSPLLMDRNSDSNVL